MAGDLSGAMNKQCSQCFETKPLDDFSPNPLGKQGRHPRCKKCSNENAREHRRKRAEREGRVVRPQALTEEERTERKRVSKRKAHLKWKYGITPEQYDKMLATQGGVCAICMKDGSDSRGYSMHVDHCHDTGKVRGLLCHRCNTALGNLGSPELLIAALRYLEAADALA